MQKLQQILSKILPKFGKITKTGSDNEQFATQQVEHLGKLSDALIVFPYGVHANVTPDSLALMFQVQGSRSDKAAIAWTPKIRPLLKGGECAFYHPPTRAIIKWDEGGNLHITTGNDAAGNIYINTTNATVNASDSVEVNADNSTTINTMNATVNAQTVAVNTETANVDASTSINLKAPVINMETAAATVTGNLAVGGGLAVTGPSSLGAATSNGVNIGNTHTHGGVETGNSSTSGPQ